MHLLRSRYSWLLFLLPLLLLSGCSAGDLRFTPETPAGFWYGLWHGMIAFITLIIHIFNESVMVYEVHNSGGWYDFGFLLGVTTVWGGGCHVQCKSKAQKQRDAQRDKEWEEIGEKVEAKVMRKLKAWAETDEGLDSDAEWEEISEKVEKKLKRKIREWAEKE